MPSRSATTATTNESSVSDSISFLRQYLDSTNRPLNHSNASSSKRRSGELGRSSVSSPSPRKAGNHSGFLPPRRAQTSREGHERDDSSNEDRNYRWGGSSHSNEHPYHSPSASASSSQRLAHTADWRSAHRRMNTFSEGGGGGRSWPRDQHGVFKRDLSAPTAGRFDTRPPPSSSPFAVAGGYRGGSAIPRILPVRTGSHSGERYWPANGSTFPLPKEREASTLHSSSATWRRRSSEQSHRDPAEYETVPVFSSSPSVINDRGGWRTEPAQPPLAPVAAGLGDAGAAATNGRPAASPPQRSAPPPPPPPQLPLHESRSDPYAGMVFSPASTHHENLCALSRYLKHYYAREVEEDGRGLETLLPEDILGLAQCFYVDLYRLIREERRQAGLVVSMFSPHDPDVGVVAESTSPRAAAEGEDLVSSGPRRGHSKAATATYTGNNDRAHSDDSDGEEGSGSTDKSERERRVIRTVAQEFLKSLTSTPSEGVDQKSRGSPRKGTSPLSTPISGRGQGPTNGKGGDKKPKAGKRVDGASADGSDGSFEGAALPESAAHLTPSRAGTGASIVVNGSPRRRDLSDPLRHHRPTQVIEAKIPVLTRPFNTSQDHSHRSHSMPPPDMQTQTYYEEESSNKGGSGRGAGAISPQAQQLLLAGLPSSPYGSRHILAQRNLNTTDIRYGGDSQNAGGADEAAMEFLLGTPRYSPPTKQPPLPQDREDGRAVGVHSPSRGQPPQEPHSGILKRPLKVLMPILRHGAGIVKFISATRNPHLRFFLVQDCLDTFRGNEVMMPHLTWYPISQNSSAAELRVRVGRINAAPAEGGKRKPPLSLSSVLGRFDGALNLVDLLGVHVGTSSAPHLFRRARKKGNNSGGGEASPVVDHRGNPIPDAMCAVLVFKTRTLGLGFLAEEERQLWVGAMMGVVEKNKSLNL